MNNGTTLATIQLDSSFETGVKKLSMDKKVSMARTKWLVGMLVVAVALIVGKTVASPSPPPPPSPPPSTNLVASVTVTFN